jgi:DNA polymerase III subunit delta
MAVTTAQQVFRELETGKWRPLYLIVGEEGFQIGDVLDRLKAFFLKDATAREFNYESWEGEHLNDKALLQSLDTLPGLFDSPDALRLVICQRFDKAPASALSTLESYLKNPSPTTCFVMQAAKVDKRKAWYKAVDAHGAVLEANEPYDRDWPKWQGYFEKKCGKRIDAEAWGLLVESSGRSLSVLWAEVGKASTYVGNRPEISAKDVRELIVTSSGGSVFDFVDDVLCRRPAVSVRRFQDLVRSGEAEVKLLSLLVRQFKIVDQYVRLSAAGVSDSKMLAGKIGVHPYFITQIQRQSRHHDRAALDREIGLLAECDYRMKTGESGLFEAFLLPYFASH